MDDYGIAEAALKAAFAIVEVDCGFDFNVGRLRIQFRTERFDKNIKHHSVAFILSRGRLCRISGNLFIWLHEDGWPGTDP